ncbi:phage N-6-adenine-methyltransferase [Enterobacter hormaechei]|uniref:phage N-6-adenine-methyltransferase n=1 Tax=Enterobacter hormaechei TaxID=158836 RepID=UPI000DE62339|nr:phage N-6-adenine-methyltransferase [Enterobacter hormaechei]SSI12807.1 phage N-6-adenine-methyltransferase [Enterobacter hormaechei]
MNYGSVCSGIEAASKAWEPLGWKPAWFSEIEPLPSAVLAHHWPEVTNLGDMTKIADAVRAGEVEATDVLVGGTPCQAFSIAGLREGLSDDRGQLTLSYVELANAIDAKRRERGEPEAIIVWENVPGVLSSKDNAFGCFLAGLAGESCELQPAGGKWTHAGCVSGPERIIAWRVLDAQFFGVAQRRRRVFVVASARKGFDPAAVLFELDSVRRDSAPRRETQKAVAALTARGVGTCGADDNQAQAGHLIAMTHEQGDDEIKTDDSASELTCNHEAPIAAYGIPGNWIGRAPENGGNATEPMVDIAPCLTVADRHGVAYGFQPRIARNGRGDMGDVCHALTAEAGETGKGDSAPHVAIAFSKNKNTQGGEYGWMDGRAPQGENDLPSGSVRSLRSDECRGASQERELEGSQAGESTATMPELPYKGSPLREEVHDVRQAAQGARVLRDALPTLQEVGRSNCCEGQPAYEFAQGLGEQNYNQVHGRRLRGKSSLEGILCQTCATKSARYAREHEQHQAGSNAKSMVNAPFAVRRLTPVECERLQGFPDNHTLIGWRGKDADECPDGPRYKAIGNSMAVPVMRWIGERIAAELPAEKLIGDYGGSKTPLDQRDLWRTPPALFASLDAEFCFQLDAAAAPHNALCRKFITAEQNTLETPWADYLSIPGYVWLNPPYSDITPFVKKAAAESINQIGTVMLVPSDTSVGWFKEAIQTASEVRFITAGRLAFINPVTGKPVSGNNKGSMLIIWRPYPRTHCHFATVDRDELMAFGAKLLARREAA